MTALSIFLIVILAGLVGARSSPSHRVARIGLWLRSPWAPVVVGIAASVIMTWVWGGSLRQVAIVHDEASYLLQARIYAAFRWTAPALPIPEFFEQYHVFVTPALFSKYPPGHAIALVPGVWLGLPGLVPAIAIGISAALIFALARRVANVWVASLTWLLWVTAPGVLRFMPSYFSETTTCALWLLGWWALLRWREDQSRRWLLLLAVCIGWAALTRPLTALLYAIPIGCAILPRLLRRHAWRDLAWAVGVGGACVALLPLWSLRTTGHPLQTPYSLYSRIYFPDDVMGFGLTSKSPERPLNADMERFNAWVRATHARHTIAALPTIVMKRAAAIGHDMWRGGLRGLLPFALIALLAGPEMMFALGAGVVLVLGYLAFGHAPAWTVYYVEIQPVLAFATAIGVWRFFSWVSHRAMPETGNRSPVAGYSALATSILLLALLLPSIKAVRTARVYTTGHTAYHRAFRDAVEVLPGDSIVVFVRYAPNHIPHNSLIVNDPDLTSARAWIVYDRGAENRRLLRLAQNRTAYLFDEDANAFTPMETQPGPLND